VEFLIAVIPFLTFTTVVLQGVLLAFADVAVERAADAAARSAVVVLDDDPRFYGGEARNSASPGGARLEAIRQSAMNVLAAFPKAARLGMAERLTVEFPSGPRSTGLRSRFGPDETVTVRVRYLFACDIPMARLIMCRNARSSALMQAESSLPNQGARYSYGGGG